MAQHGAQVTGIDISDVSIKNCEARAKSLGLDERSISFQVMDCEAPTFADGTFDMVCEAGVLHHLDFGKALAEMHRVLKTNGQAVCYEALGHNRIVQAYRMRTPHLRTEYETQHILRMEDLEIARSYFSQISVRFFHMASLAAVPVRNTRLFGPMLKVLDAVDTMVLRLPWIQRQAWMMIFVMSHPKALLL